MLRETLKSEGCLCKNRLGHGLLIAQEKRKEPCFMKTMKVVGPVNAGICNTILAGIVSCAVTFEKGPN